MAKTWKTPIPLHLRHVEMWRGVEVCATIEQIRTSGTASDGGNR